MNEADKIIRMKGIVKDFPGVRALDHVDFVVREGEILGLVGENGAGKSTLIKILAGIYQRDQGEVWISGNAYDDLVPHVIETLGIQFIHQERQLVPFFSVAQSLFLGHERRKSWIPIIDQKSMRQKAESFIENTLGISLPADALIRDLTVAQAQIVQIAKALMVDPNIIVLDEPTAPLAKREVDRLFDILRRLQDQSITIIYISHYLQEITEICDRVTVLRNGRNVSTLEVEEVSSDDIVQLMVGRDLKEMFPKRASISGEVIFNISNLARTGAFEDISIQLHRGEVLGLTGLIGSGREVLVNTLFGLNSPDHGSIALEEEDLGHLSPVQAVSNGLALVPRNRREHGLIMNMDVSDNINLASLERISQWGIIQRKKEKQRSNHLIQSLDIRTPGPQTIVRYLSGGNQQKVVLARWLGSKAKVYLLDEPTVGVDVGAKVEIYELINRLVREGAGVLFVSSDIPELIGMTDRILIMYRGRIVQEVNSSQATPDMILSLATSGSLDE